MKHFIRILFAFCLFGYAIVIQAQSTLPAAGGNAAGAGGTVSFSVGQVVYMTITSTVGSVTQGVQQPYEVSVITSVENTSDIILVCSVYPNPSTGFLTLKIGSYDNQVLSYHLYDINGNLLEKKEINGYETSVQMNNYVSGTYILKVSDNNKQIKTFKVIKK